MLHAGYLRLGLKAATWIVLGFVVCPVCILVAVTLTLAAIASWRCQYQGYKTSLAVGRVLHTRFQPVVHSFAYPFFFAAVHLEEVQDLFLKPGAVLWPLNLVMSFSEQDHLKNGEGMVSGENNSLLDRVYRLASERTQSKFQPTSSSHSVILLTHLRYYGYCFNPVSFYYIIDNSTNKVDCILAEVSNTPWNEMHVYVLHPDSVNVTRMELQDDRLRVVFPKAFHVSPFIEMNHVYDWTFDERLQDDIIKVTAKMIQQEEGSSTPLSQSPYFSASFSVTPQAFTPFGIAWTLLKYPVYCAIVQIWIHYEAFLLFYKGVVFIPHPEGAETTASRAIGNAMMPLFALKDWVNEKLKRDEKKKS